MSTKTKGQRQITALYKEKLCIEQNIIDLEILLAHGVFADCEKIAAGAFFDLNRRYCEILQLLNGKI